MVYIDNVVLASGVCMLLENDLVGFALQKMEIHPLMLLTLSMIFQTFSPTLHNPSTRHTRANYVEMILTMLKGKFNGMSIEINKNKELQQLEQAANLSTYTTEPLRRFNSIYYDDDDDEESTIPLNEIVS
ncbi:hypothetical protein Tco_0870940 [Tanacetum coccineum]